MPFQADALNDLSSRPPWSVTMQAVYFGAALLVPPGVFVSGALPQAATNSVSPVAATAATIPIPRAGRKTFSFPLFVDLRPDPHAGGRWPNPKIRRRNTCGDATTGAYAGRPDALPKRTRALPRRYPAVTLLCPGSWTTITM